MREYRYTALTTTGQTVSGVRHARNVEELTTELLQKRLVLLRSRVTLGTLGNLFSASNRAAGKELREFTRHMATCLGAGIPVVIYDIAIAECAPDAVQTQQSDYSLAELSLGQMLEDIGADKYAVEGVTFSNFLISDFLQNVTNSPYFAAVDLLVAEKGEIENVKVIKFKAQAKAVRKPASAPFESEERIAMDINVKDPKLLRWAGAVLVVAVALLALI